MKSFINVGYDQIKNSYLKHWEPLLDSWCEYFNMIWLNARKNGVNLYKHYVLPEAGIVATLGCAASRIDWLVLSERKVKRDDSAGSNLRVDLWFQHDTDGSYMAEYVECKQLYLDSCDFDYIYGKIDEAFYQVSTILYDEAEDKSEKVALVFCVLRTGNNYPEKIPYFLSIIKDKFAPDILAWCFPDSSNPNEKKEIEGVVVIGVLDEDEQAQKTTKRLACVKEAIK